MGAFIALFTRFYTGEVGAHELANSGAAAFIIALAFGTDAGISIGKRIGIGDTAVVHPVGGGIQFVA